MGLWTPRPSVTAKLQVYKDRILALCQCGHCGEGFSIILKASRHVIETTPEEAVRKRVLGIALAKHQCHEESLTSDPAETNRIVNKWHEFKRKNPWLFVKGAKR